MYLPAIAGPTLKWVEFLCFVSVQLPSQSALKVSLKLCINHMIKMQPPDWLSVLNKLSHHRGKTLSSVVHGMKTGIMAAEAV